MNILVWTDNGTCISRPDSTWKRDNDQFYVPEFVDTIYYAPALVARVERPGKGVGLKFAYRYYGLCAPAVLLYPEESRFAGSVPVAEASCFDKSSFFPYPELERGAVGSLSVGNNAGLEFCRDVDAGALLDEAMVGVTRRCYLRSGDLLIREIAPLRKFCSRSDARVKAHMEMCGLKYDFEIIY